MLKLIKLEIKRNRLKGYITAGLVITVTLIGLVYLFAAIPYLDASDKDVQIFMTYNGISTLSLVVATACFSILSSVMYNRFIIEEYTSKKVFLLFSYPVERNRVLWVKIITVFLFIVISMIFSGMIVFSIFFITESFFPLCQDVLTLSTIFGIVASLVAYSITSAALAVISLWFGYWKKSASVTIVSSVIVSSIFGSFSSEILLSGGITHNLMILVVIAAGSTLVALALITRLSQKINTMEV
ncbi:ABC transporter permease [Pseudogracilibacillus auburnensis]|uniref:ABC-2 family transporter n=1 Tax=Pseudogracilibacillus auburnensis TaxID=1494959 RepID=A0A2V3W9C2_9BACI|nr:ABC transporter permease [Pseudogracilibacillus auburnensis]PXW90650.1 ABC-2 family transporter [Pseudogracilibacillus auburnensis]